MLGDDSNLRHPEAYELSSLPVAAHDEEALVGRRLLVEVGEEARVWRRRHARGEEEERRGPVVGRPGEKAVLVVHTL